jgi:DNA-binding NtrC family response regulator
LSTVLVVEDHGGFRNTLSIALEDLGLRVFAAGSSDAAYTILGSERIDYALIDVRLPHSSGSALYDTIVKKWPHLGGRVALMTGYPEDVFEWRKRKSEVPIFEKPFRVEDVTDWMRW